MAYISNLNFYDVPSNRLTDDKLTYVHSDNQKATLCIPGPDAKTAKLNYIATPNLNLDPYTTVGCLAKYDSSSISDLKVITGNSCPNNGKPIAALQYPQAFELALAKDDVKKATSTTGINRQNNFLCRYDNVMEPNRVADIQFVTGACPSGYTADGTVNSYTFCKKFSPKPTAAQLAALPSVVKDMLAADDAADALLAEEEEQAKRLKYLEIGGGVAGILCCICLFFSSIIMLKNQSS